MRSPVCEGPSARSVAKSKAGAAVPSFLHKDRIDVALENEFRRPVIFPSDGYRSVRLLLRFLKDCNDSSGVSRFSNPFQCFFVLLG